MRQSKAAAPVHAVPNTWVGPILKRSGKHRTRVARILILLAAIGTLLGGVVGYWNTYKTLGPPTAVAVERDFKASPDVYRVRAETSDRRVVEGTWKPGYRDQFHSHPAMLWYWITDCSVRYHLPNGITKDVVMKAGDAGEQAPVASHSVENLGTTECRVLMVEAK